MKTNTIFFTVFPCMTLLAKQSPSRETGSLNSHNMQENMNIKASNKSTELKSTIRSGGGGGGGKWMHVCGCGGWGGKWVLGGEKKTKKKFETKLTASLLKQNRNTQRVEKKAVLMRERKICANFLVKHLSQTTDRHITH